MHLLVSVLMLERHHFLTVMSSSASNVAGPMMSCVNCRLSCAYAIGIQFLTFGAARSSMCCISITVSIFWSVVMPARFSVMLCVFGGVHSGVSVSVISMPSCTGCGNQSPLWTISIGLVVCLLMQSATYDLSFWIAMPTQVLCGMLI